MSTFLPLCFIISSEPPCDAFLDWVGQLAVSLSAISSVMLVVVKQKICHRRFSFTTGTKSDAPTRRTRRHFAVDQLVFIHSCNEGMQCVLVVVFAISAFGCDKIRNSRLLPISRPSFPLGDELYQPSEINEDTEFGNRGDVMPLRSHSHRIWGTRAPNEHLRFKKYLPIRTPCLLYFNFARICRPQSRNILNW